MSTKRNIAAIQPHQKIKTNNMKKKSSTQSAFSNPRALIGLFFLLAGVFLALLGFGTSSSVFAQTNGTKSPAQQPAAETETRVRITDPSLLESMGFGPDATDVYATRKAYAQLLMSPAERTAASQLEAAKADASDAVASSAFGNTTGVSSILGTDFAPLASDTDYVLLGSGTQVTCNSGTPFFRGVFANPPHGARATVRRIWYRDDHATENVTVWLERTCIPFFSAGTPEITILRMNESSGTPGWARFGPGNLLQEDIDSQSCVYAVRVRLGNSNLNCTAGNALGIAKASLSWQRQVSPPPATATFNDVPASSPQFPFVEALSGSGITSGCAPNLYCPGDPVTRGQMAVFLSRALGLNWDGPFWEP